MALGREVIPSGVHSERGNNVESDVSGGVLSAQSAKEKRGTQNSKTPTNRVRGLVFSALSATVKVDPVPSTRSERDNKYGTVDEL